MKQYLVFGLLFLTATIVNANSSDRPNILFIMSDDHAWQAISAYGSKVNKTPNIDRIAKNGMKFNRALVTNSICGPSRATILTGKYSHLNGMLRHSNTFDGSQQTYPKILQKSGYQTAIIGKWHLKTDPTGFDYWNILIGQGQYYNSPTIENGERKKNVGYTTDFLTDYGIDWIKNKRDKSKPFLLMLHHKAPHRNWQPDEKHHNMFAGETIPEPDTLFDDYATRGTPAHKQRMSIANDLTSEDLKLTSPPFNLNKEQKSAWIKAYDKENKEFFKANLKGKNLIRWKYQRYMKDYLKCVASVDDNVGRVLDFLDKEGLTTNTLLVYTSDQGFYLGEHGWFDKRFIYEQSLKTAFLAQWPGHVPSSSENNDIISNLDYAETFLDVAGAEIPKDMQGASFKTQLLGQETPKDWRKSFYYHYYEYPEPDHHVRRHYGIVDNRYKLIHFYENDVNEWELYDLKTDPQELKNIYGKIEMKDTQSRLKSELDKLRYKYQVPQKDPKLADAPAGMPLKR